MENNVGDTLHHEEQLRTTLHCDDKEKLRRKLALLQREYLRTAQRLQRAERSEVVRKHVWSRIVQQNHQDQRHPDVTPSPCLNPSLLSLDTQDGTASGDPPCQGHTGDAADSENSRRSQVIRFLLPTDAACPQTPDPNHDTARNHKCSPGLRLRSRRSRLRWERRSAEASRSTDNSEEAREQSEQMETDRAEGSEARVETEVANAIEEPLPGTDSESPSLLLTHWNTGQTETGDIEGNKIQGRQDQREEETELTDERKKESDLTSLLLPCNPATQTEGRGQGGTQNRRKKAIKGGKDGDNTTGQKDGRMCEDSSNKDTQQNLAEKIESEKSHNSTVEIKKEKSETVEGEHDVKGVGLLDSCTIVEGLLFPAEYYARTTRRMTFSKSQPDMQAIILSQLSVGRHRRGRGRSRGLNRHTPNHQHRDQHTQTDSSLTTASVSVGPRVESQAADTSAEQNSQSSSEISACQIDTDACFAPTVTTACLARGRRKRRGRGRGRPQTPRCSLTLDTHQLGLGQTLEPTSSTVSSSPSLRGADVSKPCLSSGEVVLVQDNPQPVSIHSTESSSASGQLEKVYPIFQGSSGRTDRSTQRSRGAAHWRSLLLPSSPSTQTPLLPLPSSSSGSLVNSLMNFDIPQDFHLPDDQFALLKLQKLRQAAAESGVEHLKLPYYNTRRSIRRCDAHYISSGEPVMPLPLPRSLTPTVTNSPHPTEAEQAATQSVEMTSDRESPREQHTENLHPECQTHTSSTESVSVVRDCAADSFDPYKDTDTGSQSCVSDSSAHRSVNHSVTPQAHTNCADRPAGKVNAYVTGQSEQSEQIQAPSVISSEEQTDYPGVVHALEDQNPSNHQTEEEAAIETLSFDRPLQKTPEEPSNNRTAVQTCSDNEAPGQSAVQHLNVESPKESSEPTTSPSRSRVVENNQCFPQHGVHKQLLLSPLLASAPSPFITPHLTSSALPSSLTLPSLGLTPHPAASSSSLPTLTLPPPHSPSTQALSPPALSPCPSLPPSQPTASPGGHIQAEPPQRVDPATCTAVCSVQSQGSGVQVGLRTEETAEELMMRCTHTLEAPAGGCLVDACCLLGSSGGLCVAAAGKWAVCLWSQAAADWSLTHTWAFSEPVINVFPVPDAAGLMCVTLGQLEIREVRMLSCSSRLQALLCEGVVQAVVGVSNSRVVTSSHSAPGSTLQVFTLSDSGSALSSQPLTPPGVCVGALAPVDGLSDALIGTDEGRRLFVWNLKTGQLLRRILLGDGLSHTACLRGYSDCGVLFVLLQHQLLNSLEEEEREQAEDQMCSEEERKKTSLFSLVAVNPTSGKSVLATLLYPPKAWSGRLSEADVNCSSVVGLSQSGCVCVWELGRRWGGRTGMLWAPESEGWQLARWGAGGMLVTGHLNGDVSLHCCSPSQTSLCH